MPRSPTKRADRLAADLKILRLAACGIREREMRAISRQYARMARALRVIHTWATVEDGEMEAEEVQELTEEALRRFQ